MIRAEDIIVHTEYGNLKEKYTVVLIVNYEIVKAVYDDSTKKIEFVSNDSDFIKDIMDDLYKFVFDYIYFRKYTTRY